MAEPIRTWTFATAVVHDGDRFVLVHEANGTWGLPGGRVQPGERLVDAIHRETLEEAGIAIELEGVLGWEHTPLDDGSARMGAAFLARPVTDATLKTEPDEESRGSAWFTRAELPSVRLRSPRVARLVGLAFDGGAPIPLDRLAETPGG